VTVVDPVFVIVAAARAAKFAALPSETGAVAALALIGEITIASPLLAHIVARLNARSLTDFLLV